MPFDTASSTETPRGTLSPDAVAVVDRLFAGPTHAARLETLANEHDVPMSTLRAVIAQGGGPRTFTIGRLIYCRRADWTRWLDSLAESGGTGPLTPGACGRKNVAPLAQRAA